jgi:hypothetical protein
MGVVVCLQCGEIHERTSEGCPHCGYKPADVQAKAKQSLASDQCHSREELEAIARRVKAGEPIEFESWAIHNGFMREEVKRLTAQFGTVPPPWVKYNEHPYSICWRMGGGESHMMLWREWWEAQKLAEEARIAYFRRWPPPHCWLAFLIEAVWDVDIFEEEVELAPYFERTAALGFGSQLDYERDLDDPKWLER